MLFCRLWSTPIVLQFWHVAETASGVTVSCHGWESLCCLYSIWRIFVSLPTVSKTLSWVKKVVWETEENMNKLFTSVGSICVSAKLWPRTWNWCPRPHAAGGLHFQVLGHSFLLYGPPSWQITFMYCTKAGSAVASWLVRSTPDRAVRGRCVVFLGKALYSHSASLHPGV